MIYAEVINFGKKESGKIALPKKVFEAEINPSLVAQAVYVFLSNQRKSHARVKTRSEVARSKAKWYRQKGTGRARHGARSAPLFVGGGRAHGPTGRENYKREMPKKMKKAAFLSALSAKAKNKEIMVLEGVEKIKKTKEIAEILKGEKGPLLLILPQKIKNIVLAARNIPGLEVIPAKSLNTYAVLRARKVLIAKEAISVLEEQWGKD